MLTNHMIPTFTPADHGDDPGRIHRSTAMSTSTRPVHFIEFELSCALERRDLVTDDEHDDMISRFERDENQREIDRLTAELELARADS